MLTENERKVLEVLRGSGSKLSLEELERLSGLPRSTMMAALELLKARGAVREEIAIRKRPSLTSLGAEALREGLPELVLLRLLKRQGGSVEVRLAQELLGPRVSAALGELRRRGAVSVTSGLVVLIRDIEDELIAEERALHNLQLGSVPEDRVLTRLIERRLVKEEVERDVRVAYVPEVADALLFQAAAVSRLTSDDITSGRWRTLPLREYNVEAEPPFVRPGFEHFFELFLETVREVLKEMGFSEFEYDFVVQEFWNFDVLFQAQDHPSREIHDTFWLDYSSGAIADADRQLVESVKRVHERGGRGSVRGWGGVWSEEVAKRYVLRTQMTSATIRALSLRPRVPFRIFSIGKVFRPDPVDYKRLPEFTQLDCIVSETGFSFGDLLSVLREFFSRLGFERVRFKPAYFPFTEPSVEGYVYMEGRGWVEVFGAGLFRPEVLELFGYEENVGAWGMGLERLAMKLIDVEDIRLFYSRDVEVLREMYTRAVNRLHSTWLRR